MSDPTADRPKYLVEHLGELRQGLLKSSVFVVLGVVVAFWKSELLFDFLLKPFRDALNLFPEFQTQVHTLQTLTPIEAFMVNMKLAAIVGLVLASPFILWQIWKFVAPALKPHEKGGILMVFLLGLFFFLGGLAFGYFAIVPIAMRFLIRYNLDYHFMPQWTLQGYFGFVMNFLLVFGFVFELPLVLAGLVSIGIATPAFLSQKRKHAIVGIFILAFFIAPSADPLTQTIVALPLVVLYEIGILLSRLAFSRKNKAL
jgi:sec-independent protein translocase protein TatC